MEGQVAVAASMSMFYRLCSGLDQWNQPSILLSYYSSVSQCYQVLKRKTLVLFENIYYRY